MKRLSPKSGYFIQVAIAMVFPWVISLGSYAILEKWVPGELKTSTWEWLSTTLFLACTAFVDVLVVRSNLRKSAKSVILFILTLGGIYLALSFHVNSNCVDYSKYIGTKKQNVVASCE